jgi:hypothetical protein
LPTYEFIDTKTGEEFEVFMKISEREEFLKENPHITPILTAPSIVTRVSTSNGSNNRVPDGFKEVLSKIGEAHPMSKVGGEYGDKSIKTIKTREVVRKHIDKITKRLDGK